MQRPEDALIEFRTISLEHIEPSPTSAQAARRKSFDKVALQELADSIKTLGLVNPIVVRPVPATGKRAGSYELVAGERRYLAAQLAGLERIDCNVRTLSDEAVVELQLIENLQRADLHPMHEAESYDELIHKYGHTADEIAAKVGKSRGYVYGRMKLLSLSKGARKAFYDGLLSASVAEKLARVPVQSLQDDALEELTGAKYNDGQPMSFRDAVEYIEEHFMLDLRGAPFPTDDAELNNAGPCGACPKRTGNQPELFADVKKGDTCTDRLCFAAKTRAYAQRQVAIAKEEGRPVIQGNEAKKIAPNGIARDDPYLSDGYKSLGDTVWRGNGYVKVKSLVKPGTKTTLLFDGKRAIEVVKEDELEKPKASSSGRQATSSEAAARKRAERENKFRLAVYTALRPKLSKPNDHELARAAYNALDQELKKFVWTIRGVELKKAKYGYFDRDHHEALIPKLAGAELVSFMNDCIYVTTLRTNAWSGDKTPKRLLEAAKKHQIDVAKIRRELAPKKKPKAKAARKRK
jgi:ParB/RepB/Spo0J family partition protein